MILAKFLHFPSFSSFCIKGSSLSLYSATVVRYSSLVTIKIIPPENITKKSKRKVQGVPQSKAAANPRHEEKEETDKTKQAQIEQTYEKH